MSDKKSKEDIAIHNKAARWILALEPFIGKSIKNPMKNIPNKDSAKKS